MFGKEFFHKTNTVHLLAKLNKKSMEIFLDYSVLKYKMFRLSYFTLKYKQKYVLIKKKTFSKQIFKLSGS